jgi:Domain of unknown function (DUF4129)
MARSRSRGTLVDYLVAAIEPALIMVMVGSLMFFLLDMWYAGEFLDRLRWILFWFVFGIVLITRVSMRIDHSLAKAYGIGLGGAVALVASQLAGFQPVLLVIMGIVWWATHKLTFDCTLLDEDQDAGVGLLQESGLDPTALADTGPPPAPVEDPGEMDASLLPGQRKKKSTKQKDDEARRPNAPGVWLVYFALASLPLFGLGQWLVPAVDEDRRGGLFVYFLAYIASGMGLLLATSFLNLRRYLRQRKLKMPAAMTATWLTTGAIVIIGLTVFAAALPLPGTGWSVVRGSTAESSDLRASQYAVLNDGGVKGEGAGGQKNDPNAKQQTAGKGKEGGKSAGNAKSGAPRGKASKDGAAGKKGAPKQDQSGDQKGREDRSENKTDRDKDNDQNDRKDEQNGQEQKGDQSSKENQGDASNPPKLPSVPFQAPSWLRGLFMLVGGLAFIYGLFRYGPVLLDAFRALIAALFGGFGGQKPKKREKETQAEPSEPVVPPRPFSSFPDPFASGLAQNFSPNDLVIYSFEALEAWAFEHRLARSPNETPTEFVNRLGEARSDLRQDTTRLAGYFITIVYGQKGFKSEVLPPLRQFWRALQGFSA